VERLRREVEDLRRRLAEALEARPPEPAPGEGPAPAAPRRALAPSARSPAGPRRAVDLLLESLRAACESGDTAAQGDLVNRLAAAGSVAADPLDAIVRDAVEPSLLRVRALEALHRVRASRLGGLLAFLLADPGTGEDLRLAALRWAAASPEKDPALRDLLRAAAADASAPAPRRDAAAAAFLRHVPEEALPWIRDALAGPDPAALQSALAALERCATKDHLPLLVEAVHALPDRHALGRIATVIARVKDRPWSPVQLTGAPDTPAGLDHGTAWCSKRAEEGEVWIELDYARSVRPESVRVVESLAAGAVARIQAKSPAGEWETMWEGTAPSGEAPRTFDPPLRVPGFAASTIRVVLDTDRVPYWNEVDAVELVGDGLSQWAVAARASSSWTD
jgi:hypothetical protein